MEYIIQLQHREIPNIDNTLNVFFLEKSYCVIVLEKKNTESYEVLRAMAAKFFERLKIQ